MDFTKPHLINFTCSGLILRVRIYSNNMVNMSDDMYVFNMDKKIWHMVYFARLNIGKMPGRNN